MLSATFTTTDAEFLRVCKLLRAKTLRKRGLDGPALTALFVLATFCGGYGTVGVLLRLWPASISRYSSFAIAALCASAGFLLLLAWALLRHTKVQRLVLEYNHGKLAPTTITISPTELTVTSDDHTVAYRWTAVSSVESTDEFLLFVTEQDHSPFVLARAFDDPHSFQEFAANAQDLHARAMALASEGKA